MRVGIVNDLRIVAEMLRRTVAETEGFSVAWVAYDGEHAEMLHRADPADIVLMDLVMPGMDGADTTAKIMSIKPCAILVVTATVTGNRELVFRAMGNGALDAVTTPDLKDAASVAEFRRKLISVSRLVGQKKNGPPAKPTAPVHAPPISHRHGKVPVIGIGASTGGPQALATILRRLPAGFPAAIVIVQHLDCQFVPGLQRWLSQECALPIHLAKENEPVREGHVYLAETRDHLIISRGVDGYPHLHYTTEPEDSPYRPSADVFLNSLAALRHTDCVGVLLTGMGRDGAEGLLALRRNGAPTFAQDQASSVVFGMPRAALDMGAVEEHSSLSAIADGILRFVQGIAKKPKATL
ncbi:chemotaxis-specific protein-glutamate methyltransferase CheB [Terriglobus sp. RCC_193]|uniref:chemotaxis-specific protein-glutamate methyltransferase CheB n=1 Tax=Terriglobus sp. RCC_193 TaxID=3239218 RepID=UPI0035259948